MRKGQKALLIYFNDETFKVLEDLSNKTQLSKSKIIRYLILGYTPPEAPPADYGELIYQLRCLGNNINQILYLARTNGILNPAELEKHLLELKIIENEMHDVFRIER